MDQKIFTPITLGNVTIKNRIMFSSMCVYFSEEDGRIGDCMLEYVRERAKGGVGLIVIPGSPHGKAGPGRPALSDEKYIPGWKKMADAVHEYGAKLFCQLHPAAMQAGRGHKVEFPSEYSLDTIEALIASYAECARKCKIAGVDGVEIHGAHAHEVAQFMSPHYNDRTDEYGGSVEKRAKFSQDIVRAIKAACGPEYPLIFRISGDEHVKGGRTIEETVQVAKLLVEAGADAIHVSCGMPESESYISAPMDIPDCFNADDAAVVKKAVGVPVVAVNRIVDLAEAEKILQEGKADMVAMARAHLADPELINKAQGKNDLPVRRCVGCNQGCRDAINYRKICCMQNPRLGRESVLNFEKVSADRQGTKIMIVGAGPAGLEAACDLAERGFKPVVFEQSDVAGGLVNLAAIPPHKTNMKSIVSYRVGVLEKRGIEIRYNQKVDLDLIKKEKPDVLILATGSTPAIPPIPGVNSKNVFTGDDVLKGAKVPGKKIALLGGGLISCETAEYLVEQGKEVIIFEMIDGLAKALNPSRRQFMLERMSKAGVDVNLLTRVKEIRLPELDIFVQDYPETIGGFDAVVVAAGRKAENGLEAQVKESFPDMKVLTIGDAVKPGLALDAIYQGAQAAASL